MVTYPSWMFPHTVDVILVNDAVTSQRGFPGSGKLAVALAVACHVLEMPPSRSDTLNNHDQFARAAVRRPYLVYFPANPNVSEANQLVWLRPEDRVVCYLQVKIPARSPDSGAWTPWAVYCELDESAAPPLTSTAGLSVYVPPTP